MSLLETYWQRLESRILRLVAGSNWNFKLALLAYGIAIVALFNSPAIFLNHKKFVDNLRFREEFHLYGAIKEQAIDPTSEVKSGGYNRHNRAFRLTLPLFVRAMGVPNRTGFWVYTIQLLLGFLFFYVLNRVLYRVLDDKLATFWATLGIACLYAGQAFFAECSGYGDFYSYFFLLLALYFRKPFPILISLLLAFYCDERAFVNAAWVFLFWWFVPQFQAKEGFKIRLNAQMLAVLAAWVLYWLIRLYLEKMGVHNTYLPGEYLPNFIDNSKIWGFKLLWGMEGFWLVFLLFLALLFAKKDYLRLFFILASMAAVMGLSFIIYDTTRSLSFSFLLVFTALAYLKNELTPKELRILLALVAFLCFIHPLATFTQGLGVFLM